MAEESPWNKLRRWMFGPMSADDVRKAYTSADTLGRLKLVSILLTAEVMFLLVDHHPGRAVAIVLTAGTVLLFGREFYMQLKNAESRRMATEGRKRF